MKVEPGRPADLSAVEAFLAERNALRVARRGELVSSLDHPTLLAKSDDDLVGVATYVIDAGECELLTLHAHRQLRGSAPHWWTPSSSLLGRPAAPACGWSPPTTTWMHCVSTSAAAFALCAVRPQAVTWSRQTLKPEIPTTGSYGIELRDELELAKDL
ncbi:MAG: hypothetical protein R2731_15795 [Nocardioides sp.]